MPLLPLLILASSNSTIQEAPAKNVILMIGDGCGFNSYAAASMYEGRLGKEIFNGPKWITQSMSTYPLGIIEKPQMTGIQNPELVYDPQKAWDPQNGYKWLIDTPTDSGASASAYSTGSKTYKHSICWSDLDKPMVNMADYCAKFDKAIGVVTSVEWSDATPAAFIAHNINRDNRAQIAREMVEKSKAAVIMGAAHPWYDGDGKRRATMGGADWVGEQDYITTPLKTKNGVRFIESKADFESLAKGKLDMMGCNRLVGTAQVAGGLQINRATKDWNNDGKIDGADHKVAPIFGDPLVKTVPDLGTMSISALNLLSKNKNGFFLMVEGGAIDTSNHFNWPDRMIEETVQFFRAIETVSTWVEKHGGWDKNLVLVTADHECGFVLGPQSDTVPFQPIVDMGKGKMPGLRHNHSGHTNALIPIFGRGKGANRLTEFAKMTDPIRGKYLDNTDVFKVIFPSIQGSR